MKDMGMGGAHLHCRTGLDTPYLGEEFMELVRYSHEKSNELGLLTWLYDEDRWPSGFAGGLITKDHRHRTRFLLFSPEKIEGEDHSPNHLSHCGQAQRSAERTFLGKYQVCLEKGTLPPTREFLKISLAKTAVTNGLPTWKYLEKPLV